MSGDLLKGLSACLCGLLLVGQAFATEPDKNWVSLHVDSKDRIRTVIKSEVERRQGFSTRDEDKRISNLVEAQRRKEASAYKAAIEAATSEYRRSKKRLDDLEAQFQTASYDFEELKKSVLNIETTIQNIDNQTARYQEDRKLQQDSLRKWMKTKKQGEVAVAVIYTRGFRDTAHELESLADQVSAPLMAKHMGAYIQSRSEVLDGVLTKEFIRSIEEGTAKWNRDEPILMPLVKGPQGTTYLRIKRYELYPYQAPESKSTATASLARQASARIVTSVDELKAFLAENNCSAEELSFSRTESIFRDIDVINRQAEEDQREQLISFSERIAYLDKKIASAQEDKAFQLKNLTGKQTELQQSKTELEVIRLKKESAQMSFQTAQAALQDKKRVHESIIIKTSLVTVKRSETPAEASAEAVIEGLRDVLNDARLQHSSSTTDVNDAKLVAEKTVQSVTDARIMALYPISFINEGDSIRVKTAFRVRTVLDNQPVTAPVVAPAVKPLDGEKSQPAQQDTKTSLKAKTSKKTKPASDSGKKPLATKTPEVTQPVVKPQPPTSGKAISSAKAMSCQFTLTDITRDGENLIFHVTAKNNYGRSQYLLFYDESCGCDRSQIIDQKGKSISVSRVYLIQGGQKVNVADEKRGLAMEDGASIDVELVFKDLPGANRMNLKPVVGTKRIFYRWWSETVTFNNFQLPR